MRQDETQVNQKNAEGQQAGNGISRRSFLQSAVLATCASGSVVAGQRREPRQAILIVGESVRADMLNCYRKTGLRTPNLDRLAANGMRFTKAYACQPVCAPARSAIFTGVYPHTNGVWGNSMPLGDTCHTLGQFLHDRQVHTALIGKWHLDGFDYFGTGRAPGGWDTKEWYDMRKYLHELSPQDRVRSRKVQTGSDPTWTADLCFAKRCTDRALSFLEKNAHEDFLLTVCYDEPHDPALCPIEYSRMYREYQFPRSPNDTDTLLDKPDYQRVWGGPPGYQQPLPVPEAQFFGAHTFVDAQIGRLLDQIGKTSPQALIVYVADHGVFLHSHRLTDKGPAMYDEITRTPFIVSWPGMTSVGAVNDRLVSHVDIVPTLMEYFGFTVPATLEGRSILSTLKDSSMPTREHAFMEWGRYEVDHDGFGGFQPIRCVRGGRFKLSINLNSEDELYDLDRDPQELTNLIDVAEYAQSRNALHDALLAWMNTTRDPFRGYYWGHRPWRPEYPETWQFTAMTRQREFDGYLPRELDYDTGLPMKHATRPKAGPGFKQTDEVGL